MYSIEFSEYAEKQFSKLDSQVQQRIVSVLDRIRIRPIDHLVKLIGIEAYKCRIGDYRTICTVNHESRTIFVVKVGHRKDVYE
ncbi:MAG: type II toxin-antitoxin system RelE/ParE family toxin [Candidatus Aenigmarchaeota archaeon]|nr:type II toxin-antitoxin system RelE/ParE family toxin [Candidatus Aenigmarchaeota archaeon]